MFGIRAETVRLALHVDSVAEWRKRRTEEGDGSGRIGDEQFHMIDHQTLLENFDSGQKRD